MRTGLKPAHYVPTFVEKNLDLPLNKIGTFASWKKSNCENIVINTNVDFINSFHWLETVANTGCAIIGDSFHKNLHMG